jgi:hypothetical protein
MPPKLPFLLLASTLLTGCASTQTARIGTDVLAAGAGGLIADKISKGNPYWTLAGGVAALGAAEWAHSASASDDQKLLALAYERGQAQNAQTTYDAIQNVQKNGRSPGTGNEAGHYLEIPITAPERTINGVKIDASTEYIRISTP